jgi:hypothetical protein
VVPTNAPIALKSASRGWPSVIPYPDKVVGFPDTDENAGVTVMLDAEVTTPLALIITWDPCVADPYVAAITPEAGRSALTMARKVVAASGPEAGPPYR